MTWIPRGSRAEGDLRARRSGRGAWLRAAAGGGCLRVRGAVEDDEDRDSDEHRGRRDRHEKEPAPTCAAPRLLDQRLDQGLDSSRSTGSPGCGGRGGAVTLMAYFALPGDQANVPSP